MRKLVFVVLVLTLAFCCFGHKSAMAQRNATHPCYGHGGASHVERVPFRNSANKCQPYDTYYCCDGTIGISILDYTWGCSLDCCVCRPTMCGTYVVGICPVPDTCTSAVKGEATPDGCHYVITNYDCEGNYTGQTETDTGSPPDGLTCCDAVPPEQCPEDQKAEYPAGSGNYYCKCGKVTWYEPEPWRQGMPGPAPTTTP